MTRKQTREAYGGAGMKQWTDAEARASAGATSEETCVLTVIVAAGPAPIGGGRA